MPRLFVAIDLPVEVSRELALMSCGLPEVHWLPPEQLHLTLRFIGDAGSEEVKRLAETLQDVVASPFMLHLAGIGCFPPRGQPRVLWVGVERCEALLQLHRRVERSLQRAGLTAEGRKFMPHVTLARLHGTPVRWIGEYLMRHNLYRSQEILVESFVLYESILNPRGARHYPLRQYAFT